jgi:hypothetical protein
MSSIRVSWRPAWLTRNGNHRARDHAKLYQSPMSPKIAHVAISSRPTLNEITRHLCVGTYVDHDYCTNILGNVYFDRSHRLTPSYSFDLPSVLIHARRRWLLDMGQHTVVAFFAIAGLAIDPFSLAAVATMFISWYLLRRASRLLANYCRFLLGRTHPEEPDRIQSQAIVLGLGLAGIWGALFLILFFTRGAARLELVGAFPLFERIATLIGLFAVIAILFACCRQQMVSRLTSGAKTPERRTKRLIDIGEEQGRPVTVYSEGRSQPFIGSGVGVVTWSFAQRLFCRADKEKTKERQQEVAPPDDEVPFTTEEIVAYIKNRIADLASDPNPEQKLPCLTVKNHIFVAGTHARYVPKNPEHADFVKVMSDTTRSTRHYLACQVPSWDGEVVTTVYVHVSLQGRTLYLEFSTLFLPPSREDFHVVDRPGGTGIRAYCRSVMKTLWTLPETLVQWWLSLLTLGRYAGYLLLGRRWIDRLERRRVDVGATLSVRELGAGLESDRVGNVQPIDDMNYFQYRDVVKHAKVIERRLLAAVLDFLSEKGIDTEEYTQRAMTILNNGVLHMGEGANVVHMGEGNLTVGTIGKHGTSYSWQAPGGTNEAT